MRLHIIAASLKCPLATKDAEVNRTNRQVAIDEAMYGPMDENDGDYWSNLADHLGVDMSEVKNALCGNCGVFDVTKSMLACIGSNSDSLGYCRIYQFTCSAHRTCTAWVPDGPISD